MTEYAVRFEADGGQTPIDHYPNIQAMLTSRRPSDPVYCLYPHVLDAQADRFLCEFPGHSLYAVKANPDPHVITRLYGAGIRHFDTASLPEIELISSLCPDALCYFMAPVKIRGAARTAYEKFGVRRFVVDHKDALNALVQEINPHDSIIFVRMAASNKDAVLNLSEKYGASLEETVQLLTRVKNLGAEPALAFNVGSLVLKPGAYEQALEACRDVLAQVSFPIRWLDVGGGFPVAYEGVEVPDLSHYFDVFRNLKGQLGLAPDAQILSEPGRSLVTHAMSTVTEVLLRKGDQLYLNDGIFGSFSELVCVKSIGFPAQAYARDTCDVMTGPLKAFEIYGPTCCSTDKLPQKVMLPREIKRGDWIEFGLMGSYSLSNRTHFNGFFPDDMVEIDHPHSLPPGVNKG